MIASPSSFDPVQPSSSGRAVPFAAAPLAPSIEVEVAPDPSPPLGGVVRLASAPLLGLLWLYKALFSPVLHAVAGPSCGCRFFPTCSDYAAQAIRVHGPLTGTFFAIKRVLRCTPLHPGGVDFVPPRSALRPRCARIPSA